MNFVRRNARLYRYFRGLKLENTVVRCGEHDTSKTNEEKPNQEINAKHISIHPLYNDGGSVKNLHYNYALIHTDHSFKLDKTHIYPICLPNQFQEIPDYNFEECYAMGYGKDRFGNLDNSYFTYV